MKQQIVRLSPHQNAKVAAVLCAVSSLVFAIPMFLMFMFTAPPQARSQETDFVVLLMPLGYLVFGYVFTVIGCAAYNFLFKYIGGFEYESKDSSS